MDLPLDQIGVPFRMQPGLARIAPHQARLTPLPASSALHAEKQQVLNRGEGILGVPGFDPRPALGALAQLHPERESSTFDDPRQVALDWQEDLAVLDGRDGRLVWLSVCTPSHWAPEDKLGLKFAEVHAPVADNAALLAASNALVRLVTGGACWQRHVWTFTPDPRFDQHPRRTVRRAWPPDSDPEVCAAATWVRVERQHFVPVPVGPGNPHPMAVFTIRLMIEPLTLVAADPAWARRLHDALASMSEAILAYKNLGPARAPLLRWLARHS